METSARRAARLSGTPESRAEAESRPDTSHWALGSGSDYTVFIDHLGLPEANLGSLAVKTKVAASITPSTTT